MASLNDIETKMQNIVDVLEWRSVSTITGTLPMTFRSNGTALIDYRIYGTASGAGVQTENLFDGTIVQGVWNSLTGQVPRILSSSTRIATSTMLALDATETYNIKVFSATSDVLEVAIKLLNSAKEQISDTGWVGTSASISGTDYIVVNIRKFGESVITPADATGITITKGSTAPDHYIPYGYKLPITTTSGTESKTADIYIGDSKLLSGDYVDYESGKIVRNGTPQDPPLPLPQINTYIGINTLDSAETLGEVTIKGKIKEVI